MAVVLFNDQGEFIEEVKRDAFSVLGKVVRLTKRYTRSKVSPQIQAVSVIAGYELLHGSEVSLPTVVRLEKHVGEVWGGVPGPVNEVSAKTQERAEAVMDEVQKACEGLGLEVRAGMVYEAGELAR